MKRFLTYAFLVSLLIGSLASPAQIDQILKPVEINPPAPGQSPVKKEDTKEQIAAQYFRNRNFE